MKRGVFVLTAVLIFAFTHSSFANDLFVGRLIKVAESADMIASGALSKGAIEFLDHPVMGLRHTSLITKAQAQAKIAEYLATQLGGLLPESEYREIASRLVDSDAFFSKRTSSEHTAFRIFQYMADLTEGQGAHVVLQAKFKNPEHAKETLARWKHDGILPIRAPSLGDTGDTLIGAFFVPEYTQVNTLLSSLLTDTTHAQITSIRPIEMAAVKSALIEVASEAQRLRQDLDSALQFSGLNRSNANTSFQIKPNVEQQASTIPSQSGTEKASP